MTYTPFEGHQSRLGHYYRHLYQTISYVDQQARDFDGFDKYEYVKTIRAQLSTHEQALLLVNSLTPIGQGWWRNDLMIKCRLVQNLPQMFFDETTELNTSYLFPSGYFEWEDVDDKNLSAGRAEMMLRCSVSRSSKPASRTFTEEAGAIASGGCSRRY